MKTSVLLTLAGTLLVLIAAFVFLIANDKDPILLTGAMVVVVPLLGILFVTNKTANQTNGTLTALRTENSGLRQENAQLRSIVPSAKALEIPITPTAPNEEKGSNDHGN